MWYPRLKLKKLNNLIRINNKPVPLFPVLLSAVIGIFTGMVLKDRGVYVFLFAGFILCVAGFVFRLVLKKRSLSVYLFLTSVVFLFSANLIFHTTPSTYDVSQVQPFEGKVYGKILLSIRHIVIKANKIDSDIYKGKMFR